jgi:gluconokinase
MGTFSMSTAASLPASDPIAVVVIGVTGAGKTTVGRLLAAQVGAGFVDGDDLHTDAARAKMRSGVPLSDDDRWPWLDRVGETLASGLTTRRSTIVACSALRKAYRDRLRAAVGPALRFVYLAATPEAMRARVASRPGHYMPAALVDSQFATLEPPRGEGDVIEIAADSDLATSIPQLAARLRAEVARGGRQS